MTWKFQGQNKQIRLTELEKSSLRGACQRNLLPFLTWQQFPLGSCRSPMHFPSNPHFSKELPQPVWFWTSAGTELLQLSICSPLASFFLPVHLSYFCLGETSLLLSVFLLLSPFSSLHRPGDTRLTLAGDKTCRSECPPRGSHICLLAWYHSRVGPTLLLQAAAIPLLLLWLF